MEEIHLGKYGENVCVNNIGNIYGEYIWRTIVGIYMSNIYIRNLGNMGKDELQRVSNFWADCIDTDCNTDTFEA